MKVLLSLICVLVAVQARRNVSEEVKGLRKLMKKADSGFFATCEIVLFSETVTFDTAIEKCKNFNIGMATAQQGYLATVNSAIKNEFIKELLNMAYPHKTFPKDKTQNVKWCDEQWAWVGLQKTENNVGRIKGGVKNYNPNDWQWAANGDHPVVYENWMSKQPDQRTLKKGGQCTDKKCYQNQMRINHAGIWDDTYKYKKHPYACDYQGKYIISSTHAKWPKAKLMCEEAGLILAKVRNAKENEEIKQAAAYFLGERVEEEWDQSNWFWIGGNDMAEEGVYRWSDDDEEFDATASWISWRNPNPDNAERKGSVGQDAISISKWGKWDDSYAEKRKRPFACMCPGSI